MAMYATAAELQTYMGETLDTDRAELVLTLASAAFAQAAGVPFTATTVTYARAGSTAASLVLPFRQVSAVSEVRVNGVAVTGWSLVGGVLYRAAGFGSDVAFPPDNVAVDLTFGYASASDDVKAAVLDTAAQAYNNPVSSVLQESVDDYSVRFAASGGGVRLTPAADELARSYRGPVFA